MKTKQAIYSALLLLALGLYSRTLSANDTFIEDWVPFLLFIGIINIFGRSQKQIAGIMTVSFLAIIIGVFLHAPGISNQGANVLILAFIYFVYTKINI